MTRRRGFTLVEMMVVMAIIVTILAIAIPFYSTALIAAKESVLRSNLFTLRSVIDQYTYDKEGPPQSVDELVTEGYLREVPIDPFTDSRDSWEAIVETDQAVNPDCLTSKVGRTKRRAWVHPTTSGRG